VTDKLGQTVVSNLKLSPFGRVYLWTVISVGLAVIGNSILTLYRQPIESQWFIIAALTLVSGSATVRLPSTYASISISETFVFTAVLLYGPAAGTVLVALDGLVISFWIAKRHKEPHRVLFNMSAPAVSAWCSANLFFIVAGIAPLVERPAPIHRILPALILFAVAYFTLNSWLITFIIALEKRLSPTKIWAGSFLWWSMNYFCGASVAILFVGFNRTIDLGYLGVILPLLLVVYATFKTSMGRVEDADKHVEQINRMYLSTIETLAMAIDAKDQVTHGHIRRVQAYAIGLAKSIGIRDHQLLKAIEAAALLHDMGKLAVPEYILNKPGKLTEAEFDKMKLHASIGADILSAIDFPYPVVPIVRHHHENWNGTGYPAGLKGTAIPIGARILSVVDCFDALTSDRPYRPALSDDEAIHILMERRGTMYDPLVVDTFIRVHQSIAPEPAPTASHPLLTGISSVRKTDPDPGQTIPFDKPTTQRSDILSIHQLARTLAGQVTLSDAADLLTKHLGYLVPSSLCVLYLHDSAVDELAVKHVSGQRASTLNGLRIPLGQRLSGWVAANHKTILNSDPVLDLYDIDNFQSLQLRSCLSTPLLSDGRLIGVISLYSNEQNGFNDDHRRIVEAVSQQIAFTVSRAIEFDILTRRDSVTGLPHSDQLERLIATKSTSTTLVDVNYALLLIEVTTINQFNVVNSPTTDEIVKHVVMRIQNVLRFSDILFRHSRKSFVAFLNQTDGDTADSVAERIRDSIKKHPFLLANDSPIAINVAVTRIGAHGDGELLVGLEDAARTQHLEAVPVHHRTHSRIH
jgi:diguanylate cyclase (GGDEF)-like protein/putative nucleotidyltransferase with HDIG domain